MLSAFLVAAAIISVFADIERRHFSPQLPLDHEYNADRIWVHLRPKCFADEASVVNFKDHLLSKYACISYNNQRTQIYKHAITANVSVWSLWLQKTNDLQCLATPINLPQNILAACIDNVYFEPVYPLDCATQILPEPWLLDLWSLDVLDSADGAMDNEYTYRDTGSAASVQAIILDTGIDTSHTEFFYAAPQNLFTGTPSPTMSLDHGTHVAGTVLGEVVGGSKRTKLLYYPVCQAGSGCAWSDIEGGYNAAIAYMQSDTSASRYVINYSVGGLRSSLNEEDYNRWGAEINAASGIWVTSAGNNGANACNYAPSFSEEALTVGAYELTNWQAAYFSNWGSCVDVYGPGVLVESAAPNGQYTKMSGTSMSSPNIAAIVVNLLKTEPGLSLAQIKSYMIANARNVNQGGNWGNMNQAYLTCSNSFNE